MTPHAYVAERQTSVSAWAHFSSTFFVICGLLDYEPNFRAAAKKVMWDHVLDGVPYMEVRANFLPKSILAEDMQTKLPHPEWCRIWLEVCGILFMREEGADWLCTGRSRGQG